MLGAQVTILTGVSPHNARALVTLGVDLSRLTTRSSLEGGLILAFQMLGGRRSRAPCRDGYVFSRHSRTVAPSVSRSNGLDR